MVGLHDVKMHYARALERVGMKTRFGTMIFSLLVISQSLYSQVWTKITPNSPIVPSPRYNSSAVFDEVGKNVIIFGGRNSSGNLNEVWSFNLDSLVWTNLTPSDSTAPAPRFAQAAVFDSTTRTMFIWSGQGSGFYNDLWALSLTTRTWTQIMPAGTIPNPRYGSASVYDPVERRFIIFAGFTTAGRFNDTQAYDVVANSWTELSPSGARPELRCLHTATYDAGLHRMIIYGGQHSGPLDDIWAFDLNGNTWSNLTPSFKPAGRLFSSSVYVNGKIIIFGGQTNAGSVNELWSFSLSETTWTGITASGTSPSKRNSHVALYLPKQEAMFMFGGIGDSAYNDVWILSGLSTVVSPSHASPVKFSLQQNYPNPFNPSTTFEFQLEQVDLVSLKVFDVLGKEQATIVQGTLSPGTHRLSWDAVGLPSGIYYYRLHNASISITRKMMLAK